MSKYLTFLVTFILVLNTYKSIRIICEFNADMQSENGNLLPEGVNSKLCTHINFNYLSISNEFELMFNSPNDHSILQRLVSLKYHNKDVKIIISVGGWKTGSLIFSILANSVASRAQFTQSVHEFLHQYECDGVNIAWMHPSQRGGIPLDKIAYSVLLMDLKQALYQDGYLLSISGGNSQILVDSGYDVSAISNTVDFINVMSYDMKGPYDGVAGHPSQLMPHQTDPIKLRSANQHSVINYWIKQGAPPAKINFGISFQAKKFNLLPGSPSVPGSPIKSDFDSNENSTETLSYSEVCKLRKNSTWVKASVDADQQAPYMFGPNPQNEMTEWIAYSDMNTMRINADYIIKNGLGGVAVWSLEYDDFTGFHCKQGPYPLLNRLNKALRNRIMPETITYGPTILMTYPVKTTTLTTTTATTQTTQRPTRTQRATNTTTKLNIPPSGFKVSSQHGNCFCEENFDYFRNDLYNMHSSTNEDCCNFCLTDPECKSYTFISMTASCWLKSTTNPVKIKAMSRISCKPMPKQAPLVEITAQTHFVRPTKPTLSINSAFKQIEVNYPGNDIVTTLVSNSGECASICDTTYNCNGWSFDSTKQKCHVKNIMLNPKHDINFTSGFPSFDSFICRTGSFLVPNVLSSCSSFFACSKDLLSKFRTKIINCPPNLLFNKLNNRCDLPMNVQC